MQHERGPAEWVRVRARRFALGHAQRRCRAVATHQRAIEHGHEGHRDIVTHRPQAGHDARRAGDHEGPHQADLLIARAQLSHARFAGAEHDDARRQAQRLGAFDGERAVAQMQR